jgi:drug/metabolite transporter (DMT)-like permease
MARRLAFAALIALFSLVWSSAFVVAKIALVDFDPFAILALRFALAAALLAPVAAVTARRPGGKRSAPASCSACSTTPPIST